MSTNSKTINRKDMGGNENEEYDPELIDSLMRDEGTPVTQSTDKVPGLYHRGVSGRHTVFDPYRKYSSSLRPDLRDGSKSVPTYTDIKKGLDNMKREGEWGGSTRRRKRARKTAKRRVRKTRRTRTTRKPGRRLRSKTAGKRRSISRKRKTRARNH